MAIHPALKNDLSQAYDEDLHARFLMWKDQSGKVNRVIAGMVGRSEAAIFKYTNREYEGPLPDLERDIKNLLEKEEDLDFVIGLKQFCRTSVATQMWEVLQFCDSRQKMGAILAPSGSGKTEVCLEYKRRNRATVFVTSDISTRSIGTVVRLIVRHTGGVPRSGTISDMLHTLIDRLKGSQRLLIIDDAHFLSWEAFEVIRKLYDSAKIGIVYLGQERLYDQMRGANNKAYLFEQIFSRISIKHERFTIKRDDVKLILTSMCPSGLDKGCTDFLYKKACGKGRFRSMVNLLEVAIEICKTERVPLDISMLMEADQFLMR